MAKRSKMTQLTKPAAPTSARPSPANGAVKKPVLLRLNPEAHKQLKLAAVERERTGTSILTEALNDWFEKENLDRCAVDWPIGRR